MFIGPSLIHFTQGGPWFEEYRNCQYADLWFAELMQMCGITKGLANFNGGA